MLESHEILLSVVCFGLQETRHLSSYLVELKKASAEEMRKSVYANYAAFIRCVCNLLNIICRIFAVF